MNMLRKCSIAFFHISLLSGCVAANQDVQVLQNKLLTQEQTIQSLNSQLSSVQPAQADAWLQLQALREEIAVLRGSIENMELALRPLGGAAGIGQKLSQHDRALRLAESQLGLKLQLGQPIVAGNTSTGINPLPSVGFKTTPEQSTKPTLTPVAPAPTPTPTTSSNTAQTLYDHGISSFNGRNYQKAVNAFTDFINTYPNNQLTSNSYYWQGESYYQLKNYAAAALAYEEVISNYPKSDKAPSSYLKQGMAFAALKKPEAAKERYNQLLVNYPKAPEAVRAKQLLTEL